MRKNPVILAILLTAAIFVADLLTPLGDAIWILYIIPLLIVSSQLRKRYLLLVTALSCLLIILDHFLSPEGPSRPQDAMNRIVGISVQVVMAFVLMQRNRMNEQVDKHRRELEQEVRERRAVEIELRRSQQVLVDTLNKEKQLQEELRQSQKMEALGTLAGGIAHDFNNILAAMIGFTELAKDRARRDSRQEHHLRRVLEAGLRGRDLVRQMLTFSRKKEQEKRPLELTKLVEETTKLLRASIPSTTSIRIRSDGSSGFILADPTQIEQVLMNLCTNAAHAIGEAQGTIEIEVTDCELPLSGGPEGMKPGPYARLMVRDTGAGIPADIIDKIFDPFFTTKAPGEGTGLGLSVVHGIVKEHDGCIAVESAPGKGAAFSLYFPKVEERVREETPGEEAVAAGHERILFVDDEAPLVEMGQEILADLGYKVESRTSGREALSLLRLDPSRFDLVITDQTMPEMTGVDFAREVLSIRPDMPVILATGFSTLVDADSAKEAGIRGFVMKPLTKREIGRTVRQVLDG